MRHRRLNQRIDQEPKVEINPIGMKEDLEKGKRMIGIEKSSERILR